MVTREKLIEWLEESHRHMELLVAQVGQGVEIYPGWTVREVLAHFTGWDDAVIASLKSHAAGDVPVVVAPRGPDVYNAATVNERASLNFGHIYREWQTTHEQLKITIQSLPPEKMDQPITFPWGQVGTVEDLVIGLTHEHESSHAKDIEAVLEKLAA